MRSKLLPLLALIAILVPVPVFARGHGGGGSHRSSGSGSHHAARGFGGRSHRGASVFRATGVARDSHGRIRRSASAKNEFKRAHRCPSNGRSSGACPGYVIDHVHPLKRGGADAPSNMQWQTKAAAKAKDKWE